MTSKPRILHISPAHAPTDPRIVYKQAASLAGTYEVWCLLPNARPVLPAVRFIRLPYFRRLWLRAGLVQPLILWHIVRLRPRLVHLYMPELLPLGFLVRVFGIRVIYEVQENLYLKLPIKRFNNDPLLTRLFRWFDRRARRQLPIIFTEHRYLNEYRNLTTPHVVIYNYPDTTQLRPAPVNSQSDLLYIGGVTFARALDTMVGGLARLQRTHPSAQLHLFGPAWFSEAALTALPDYATARPHLHFHGYVEQQTAFQYAGRVVAGLALLKPVGDYPDSYPTKLFEYMALGLPVVTSDFSLYRTVVETHRCGFCIDPGDPDRLADVLAYLLDHPAEARAMGQRGRQAVEQHYNWETEADRLRAFYQQALA